MKKIIISITAGLVIITIAALISYVYRTSQEQNRKKRSGLSHTNRIEITKSRSGTEFYYYYFVKGTEYKVFGGSITYSKCKTMECFKKNYSVMYDTLDPENSYILDFYEE